MIELLGQNLKSDELIDLLETWDVEVTYEYDRLHENTPDIYWAPLKEKGILLRFDQSQNLDTVFIYRKEKEGFSVADPDFDGIERLETYEQALDKSKSEGIEVTEGEAEFLGEHTKWIRFEYPNHSVHYSYDPVEPTKITLQRKSEPARAGNG